MEFLRHTLANGLEVLAERNEKAYSTAIGYFVKTGARDESLDVWGVSHFLEHMVFKGTLLRSADDVNRELDAIGSHSNAYTSEEQTVYHAVVLPEYVDRTVDLLSDLMRPALRAEDLETEKQVILEEIAKYDDQPPFGAFEKAMALHFESHSLGRSVLGTRESIIALGVEPMRRFHATQYSPRNMALVATGNVDFEQLVALAERHAGGWPAFEGRRDPTRARRVPSEARTRVVRHPLASQQYVILVSDGPAADDAARHAGRLLATILGDDTGSRMFWDLVDTGRAECAAMGSHEFQGTGLFLSYLCCESDDASSNLDRMRTVFADAHRRGVTLDELDRVKSKICSHIVLSSERAANRLFAVGGAWLTRNEYRTVREVVDAYQRVTLDDIHALLDQFPLTRHTVCAVGPLERIPSLA
ncbi:MAG: insulinase family protein [Planctomycetes bacterium]|nr:insulinase family protein [Planctomycetota bacterium]